MPAAKSGATAPKDLTGHEYGLWTVLSRADGRGAGGSLKWLCRCDPARGGCGLEKVIVSGTLRSGSSLGCKSCREKQKWDAHPTLRSAAATRAKKAHRWKCLWCAKVFTGSVRSRYCAPKCGYQWRRAHGKKT